MVYYDTATQPHEKRTTPRGTRGCLTEEQNMFISCTPCLSWRVERLTGIEPAYQAWEACALPLSYSRNRTNCSTPQPTTAKNALFLFYFLCGSSFIRTEGAGPVRGEP